MNKIHFVRRVSCFKDEVSEITTYVYMGIFCRAPTDDRASENRAPNIPAFLFLRSQLSLQELKMRPRKKIRQKWNTVWRGDKFGKRVENFGPGGSRVY